MSDLPLDETALEAAAKATWEGKPPSPKRLVWDQLMPSAQKRLSQETAVAISTYLRGAAWMVEYKSEWGTGRSLRRLVGPWEPIPVVQAESERGVMEGLLGGFSAGKKYSDSSQDLEKDEPEWALNDKNTASKGWRLDFFRRNPGSELHPGEVLVVPKARLQQVEAERDEAKVWSESAENPAFDLGWSMGIDRGSLINRAELSIAREALQDALEGLKDMIAYVPEQFQEKWEHPAYVERAEAVLARLQAKEEGS